MKKKPRNGHGICDGRWRAEAGRISSMAAPVVPHPAGQDCADSQDARVDHGRADQRAF